ncbi:MAG TPA: glucose-6-phosphate isomerase, partial [Chitinophagaceae bacterium]|nr:glucose-6-phosphate isomerase [Chitinophagaceae bacterium]
MLPSISPVQTEAWKTLTAHQLLMKARTIRSMFEEDPERFNSMSLTLGDILFDYSKNIADASTLRMLFDLAKESGVKEAIVAMFSGEAINRTENRSVLHTALRNFSGEPVYSEGKDVMPEVR